MIDRLGEFEEVIQAPLSDKAAIAATVADAMPSTAGNGAGPEPGPALAAADSIQLMDVDPADEAAGSRPLLELEAVTLRTPNGAATLVERLDVAVRHGLRSPSTKCCHCLGTTVMKWLIGTNACETHVAEMSALGDSVSMLIPMQDKAIHQRVSWVQVSSGESLLIAGASGAGKTSTLRAIAGLWSSGSGVIRRRGRPVSAGSGGSGDIFFVPQVRLVPRFSSQAPTLWLVSLLM